MKSFLPLVFAVLLACLAPAATPTSAHGRPTVCATTFSNTVISGDLLVPQGVYCELDNATVEGNIRVRERSTLAMYDSRVGGTVTAADFELVLAERTSIGGDIRLNHGVSIRLEGAVVEGDARLNDGNDTRILASNLAGGLVVRQASEFVQFCGSTVGGDARFAGNESFVSIGGELPTCSANTVRGNLRVHNNQQEVTVANNTVGQNLVCANNELAPLVYANLVAGNAKGQCGAGETVTAAELGMDR